MANRDFGALAARRWHSSDTIAWWLGSSQADLDPDS